MLGCVSPLSITKKMLLCGGEPSKQVVQKMLIFRGHSVGVLCKNTKD